MTALKLSAVALATASMLALSAMPVLAQDVRQEQHQELEQELELECETGAYGQTTTCKVTGEQRGEQRQEQEVLGLTDNVVVLESGRVVRTHAMADTAVNPIVLAAAATIMVAGAGAAAYKLTNRA